MSHRERAFPARIFGYIPCRINIGTIVRAEHRSVYTVSVKRRELESQLAAFGWRFLRRGGRHDVWTDGEREEAVPRHREINEQLARAILRRARKG